MSLRLFPYIPYILAAFWGAQLAAQPVPSITAVVDAAGFRPGISAGSWISIFGSDLATTTRRWRAEDIIGGVLPTELDGVRVVFGGKSGAVSFISPGQLNVQVPDGNALGPVALVVERGGVSSNVFVAELAEANPAFFHFDPQQRRYLAAVHPDGASVGKPNLFPGPVLTRTAKPGDILLLFGTGFGPTLPAVEAGRLFSGAAPLTSGAKVYFNGIEAAVQFGGLSAAGLNQLNVVVPENLPPGDAEVVAFVSGRQTEPGVFVTIGDRDTTRPTAMANVDGARDVPRNAASKIVFSEAMDPSTINSDTIYWQIEDSDGITPITGMVSLDATRTVVELSPEGLLPARRHLVIQIEPEVADASGNRFLQTSYPFASFWTGASMGGDPAPPMHWPAWLSTEIVPTNFPWWELEQGISSVALDPQSFTGDLVILRDAQGKLVPRKSFQFPQDLAPSTTYTLDVQPARDFEGRLVSPPPSISLRTSTGPDSVRPEVIHAEPSYPAPNVPVDAKFVFEFSERVWVRYILLYSPFQGGELGIVELPYVQSADGLSLTAVPPELMYPNTQYSVTLIGRDLGGNRFDPCCNPSSNYFFEFVTGGPLTPDTERPRLLSSNPPDGAKDVTTSDFQLTFSERLQTAAVRQGIALYVDGQPQAALLSMTSDGATVNLRIESKLPNLADIDIVVSETVTDLSGNPSIPAVVRFGYVNPNPEEDPPFLHSVRPPGGAKDVSRTAPIYAFFTKPIDPASAAEAISVFQNDVKVTGQTTVEANNQVLRFAPTTPYAAGAEVRFVVDFSILSDPLGRPIGNYAYETRFTAAGGALPSVVTSWVSPSTESPRNAQFLVTFDRPMLPSSFAVNTVSFSPPLPLSWRLENNNQRLRVIPGGLLPANSIVQLILAGTIRAVDGTLINYMRHTINTTDEVYTTPPYIVGASPLDGSQGVGINGTIDFVFSRLIHPSTVNESTIRWTDGGGQGVPCSIEFSEQDGRTSVHITPHDPFHPSSPYTVTVSGVEDLAGNQVATTTRTFTSGTGPDVQWPQVVEGPSGFATPLNAVLAISFDEPLNIATVNSKTVLFYRDSGGGNGVQSPAEYSLSPDGRTILVKPVQQLEPHASYSIGITNGVRDSSGNQAWSRGYDFSTGATVDLTPLELFFAAPAPGASGVPINQSVVLVFDSMLQPGSVGENVRIEQGGQPVSIQRLVGNAAVELKPQQVLKPSTAYRWVAEDLRDLAGNPMAAPLSGTFTTGPSIDLSPLLVESVAPADGATNVSRNVVIAYRYSSPFNPRTVYVDPDGLRDLSTSNVIPYAVSYSPDLTTLYVTPATPLPANTTIQVRHTVGIAANLVGSSGAQPGGFTFTTGN